MTLTSLLRPLAALVVVCVLGAGGSAPAQEMSVPPDRAALENAIRDYILAHPEVIIESVRRYQQRQQEGAASLVRETIRARFDEIFNDPAAPVAGNPAGDVTLVEFFDYNCPYCKRVRAIVAQAMAEDAGLRVVFKEFPILAPSSTVAARAALAARKQAPDKYLAFHDALMENRSPLNPPRILAIAEDVGLDTKRLRADMKDDAIQTALERNRALADDLGIRGTPAFVIGDRLYPGAMDLTTLKRLIDEARSS